MSQRVTQNTDSYYQPMVGRKKGSQTIRSRNWLGNIFPISLDQSSRTQIWVKKYVSGKLFTSLNRVENVLKSDLRSPF